MRARPPPLRLRRSLRSIHPRPYRGRRSSPRLHGRNPAWLLPARGEAEEAHAARRHPGHLDGICAQRRRARVARGRHSPVPALRIGPG